MTATQSTDRRGAAILRAVVASVAFAMAWGLAPASVFAADAPNTCAAATPRSANTSIADTISSSTDVDWFRFTTTSAAWTLVTLGGLPADFDLSVYSTCSTLVATSHRSGTAYDEVYAYLGAGTYRVKVVGYAGAHSTTAYALRFRPLAWGVQVLSYSTFVDSSGYVHVVGEVLNNTAEHRRWIEIDASYLNAAGATAGTGVGYAKRSTLAPRSRSPFEIVTRRPTGYARATARVCTPGAGGTCVSGQTTSAALGGMSVTSVATSIDALGRKHYTGSVVNGNAASVYLTREASTLYNAYGYVVGVATDVTSPSTLGPSASGSFDAQVSGVTTSPNLASHQAQAGTTGCSVTPRYASSSAESFIPPIARPSSSLRVALTFDMGGRMTPATKILGILIANHVCATVFPTGAISRTAEGQAALAVVKANPQLFEVGNHTMHHCDLVHGGGGSPSAADAAYCDSLAPSPSEAAVKQELTDAETWISQYSGQTSKPFWRAPYGTVNATVLRWAAEAGWTKQFKWDIDTIDWKPISDGGPTARTIVAKVVNNAKSGSVVLMHLGGFETADALQAMIDGLRSRGFILTSLSDILQ